MLSESEQVGLAQMTKAIFQKLGGFFNVDAGVQELFGEICKDSVELAQDTVIVQQDGEYGDVFLIENGWVIRARHLPEGTRQIVNIALPGDFIALNAILFTRSDFELICKTDVTAYRFRSNQLGAAIARHPSLSAALFWANSHEESMLAERIVSLGRRSARARTAHVLCEIITRLEIIGVEDAEQLIVPISQDDFSDILGISIVHMNKTLRGLERDGVISFRNALLVVMDRPRLEVEAGFEAGYLHFTQRKDARLTLLAS